MARSPYSLLKRPTKKSKYVYYIRLWLPEEGKYSTGRSAAMLAIEMGISPVKWPPTTRAGARYIAEAWIESGGYERKKNDPLLVDYCASFWDWEKSDYIRGKIARGQQIGKLYCHNMAAAIERHIKPRMKDKKMRDVTAGDLDKLQIRIKEETGLGARAVNAAMSAVCQPLREAYRLGVIPRNPADGLHKIGDDTKVKGILTSDEIAELFAADWEQEHYRLAVAIGAYCGARLGEVLALHLDDLAEDYQGKPVLWIRASWSVVDGRKSTKTGNIRVVPISEELRDDLRKLADRNPHKEKNQFIFWDFDDEAEPISHKKIEGAFYRQLRKIGIDEDTRKERNITYHSLRHAMNSALRGAIPDTVLRKAMGHATAAMTEHYDHLTDENLSDIRKAQEEKIVIFRRKQA